MTGQIDNPLVREILGAWPQGEAFPSFMTPAMWSECFFAYQRMEKRLVPSKWRRLIGRTIESKREALHMEPHYLASMLGVPTGSVRLIERGGYAVDWATARGFYKALDLDPKDFPDK